MTISLVRIHSREAKSSLRAGSSCAVWRCARCARRSDVDNSHHGAGVGRVRGRNATTRGAAVLLGRAESHRVGNDRRGEYRTVSKAMKTCTTRRSACVCVRGARRARALLLDVHGVSLRTTWPCSALSAAESPLRRSSPRWQGTATKLACRDERRRELVWHRRPGDQAHHRVPVLPGAQQGLLQRARVARRERARPRSSATCAQPGSCAVCRDGPGARAQLHRAAQAEPTSTPALPFVEQPGRAQERSGAIHSSHLASASPGELAPTPEELVRGPLG